MYLWDDQTLNFTIFSKKRKYWCIDYVHGTCMLLHKKRKRRSVVLHLLIASIDLLVISFRHTKMYGIRYICNMYVFVYINAHKCPPLGILSESLLWTLKVQLPYHLFSLEHMSQKHNNLNCVIPLWGDF